MNVGEGGEVFFHFSVFKESLEKILNYFLLGNFCVQDRNSPTFFKTASLLPFSVKKLKREKEK